MKFDFKMISVRLTVLTVCISFLIIPSSCNYLDIVPDNVATLDFAFRLRSQAKKFLFTCYSYMPERGNWQEDPAMVTGDEVWFFYPRDLAFYGKPPSGWEVARGNQSVVDPYFNYWDGKNKGKPLYQGIRDCNIFLANINEVPDMDDIDREKWISEVLFLKAYYHWFLFRMYGPIPIVDKNKPVSADVQDVKLERQPVDSCINYIVNLLDSAALHLPFEISERLTNLGRITRPIALALKARVLITAASPLFNGNSDYSDFENADGKLLFNPNYDPTKWEKAAEACKDAIDLCQALGYSLYYFQPQTSLYKIGSELTTQMDIRNAVCDKWNNELIWGQSKPLVSGMQKFAQPILNPNGNLSSGTNRPKGEYAPTLRIAEMFYTNHGLPINQDKTWDYNDRYRLDTAELNDALYIKPDYVTAHLNFDREPRFYADLGFDGGQWYGQGKYDESDMWHVEGKKGQYSGQKRAGEFSITGYYCKKIVNFENVLTDEGTYQRKKYPFPIFRLADLYLYYAEALNEVKGPTSDPDVLKYIDLVRARAGVPSVEDAWTNYAKNPTKYTTKDGFRDIIHRERLIEMAFEGNRYWDLKRWKKAETVMSQPIRGWSVKQEDPVGYYQVKVLYDQVFKRRDYFWPIREHDLIVNHKLSQNPGW